MRPRLSAIASRDGDAGASAPEAAVVSSLIVSFHKALKAFRLYPAEHPALLGFTGDFHRELEEILARTDPLTLRFEQTRITCGGVVVYEGTDREENLPFRLFIHGVREFSFHRGVPAAETAALAQVLHRTLGARTAVEDLLSQLWEKDFSYITFVVLEDFLEEMDQPELTRYVEEEARKGPEVGSFRATIQPVLSRLLRQARPGDLAALPGIFHLDSAEDSHVRALIDEERGRDLPREMSDLALEVVRGGGGADAEEILALVFRALQGFLADGAFRSAASLVSGLSAHVERSGDAALKTLVSSSFAKMDAGRILADIRPYLVRVREDDLDDLARVLSAIGPAAHFAVAALLDEDGTEQAALGLLRRAGPACLPLVLKRLENAAPAKAVALLRIVAEVGDARALNALGGPLRHADPGVRHEAWRTLRRVGTADAFPLLREILLGPDPDMRLLALGALDSLPPVCYRDALLNLAEDPHFAERAFGERREIFVALGRNRDHATEEFLLRTLRRRSLFRRQAIDELRACAIAGLAVRGTDRARDEIRRCLKDRSRIVRQAAATALGLITTRVD